MIHGPWSTLEEDRKIMAASRNFALVTFTIYSCVYYTVVQHSICFQQVLLYTEFLTFKSREQVKSGPIDMNIYMDRWRLKMPN